ncbi:P12 family lipoprotein (plasmid) [Borreliella yangtzensis]|uniref:BBH37-like helical domain-containing protein n=1 Tax=Borreliella yangtzensis TaxID=683292 RepID=A0ABR6PFJ2_9SPIR|nr:hypothetical protein [Borreliella yangtzensis]
MKKKILVIYMLILLSLLACDINANNELLIKVRENKKVGDLNSKDINQKFEKKQEGEVSQSTFVKQQPEEGVKEVVQDVSLDSVNVDNVGIPVILNSPYYPHQKEIETKEGDLVLITNEEKEADKAISNVKRVLGGVEFAKLVLDACKLQNEYEQLESSFYDTLSELKDKIKSYPRNNKRQRLIQLRNQLDKARSNVDRFRIQVDSGLIGRVSSKSLFEKSQSTLRVAITKRLKDKRRSSWSRERDSDLVARQARMEAESALNQLESSSIKLIEAMGIKKEIEALVEDSKSALR